MQLRKTWRFGGLVAILALVLIVGPYALTAQGSVVSSTVSGQLNEQFAKHYLELQVIDSSQPVKIKMDYQPQHSNTLDESSGFYVFKQSGFDRYINAAPPSKSVFSTGSLETMGGIKRKTAEIGSGDASEIVTIVVYNDTTLDLSYTLTGENVTFVDESGDQVVSGSTPSAPATSTPAAAAREAAAAAPVAVVTTGAVKSSWVRGELNEQFAKHYLGVEIVDTSQPATIKMVYDPQNSQQVDDSSGFYVFKQTGYDRYLNASPPSDSVFLTGSLESMDGIKRKVVEVSVDDVSDIVALVTYNDTTMSFSYTLTGENILFLDDSGEQVEGDRVVVQQPAVGTGASPAAVATDITPGSSYTVQTGDTLGTISLRAYGSTTHWSAICTANSLTNCDLIEAGDNLTIPILAQTDTSGTGGTATPAATAEAMPEATAEATAAATAAATAEAMPEATAVATPEATAEAMPEPTSQADSGGSNLIEVAEDYEQLDILLLALDLAGLSATIADAGPFTIFAPTNAAFASLPEARLDMLMADSALLAETLKFHVVSGSLKTTDLATLTTLTTLQGGTIDVSTGSDGSLAVEGISIVTSDVEASNGVIHFIHQLLPDPDENASQ
jgi:uncharacterized surface protein with fasciclin (FAS1) repeats